ncbi:MAG: amidohydrolase family protein, partial [Gemmatimonadetes bacterium]|nr:amidohydrolase family protein [Gemmatimonadota bacterium]
QRWRQRAGLLVPRAYESRPDFTGVIRIPAEAFYPVPRRAHELGWQLVIHTMGDGAVKMVVDQLERILEEMPRENHRHYLHHVAVKPPEETIDKMARWGSACRASPASRWDSAPLRSRRSPASGRPP